MSSPTTVIENGRGRYQQDVIVNAHRLIADEPTHMGGEDAGPAPFDYLLAGLGACTSMTLRMYAERKEWPLRAVRVALVHEKIAGRDHVRRNITLDGPLSDEQRARLLEIANKCPVHKALRQPLDIESNLT